MSMYDEKGKTSDSVLADVGTRFFALVIDNILLVMVAGLLGPRASGGLLAFIVGGAYHWYFLTHHNGQTLGKSMLGLRVVKADGTPLTDADALLRYVGYYLNSFFFGLGWIWALFDSEKQGLHDKLARTYVVKA
jgi:uncharacterized RDD family membrane protein YckC